MREEGGSDGGFVTLADIFDAQKAGEQRKGEPAASGIGGRAEELAGKAAGCEGMEKEGAERQAKS